MSTFPQPEPLQQEVTASGTDWQNQVVERLAAHRTRRTRKAEDERQEGLFAEAARERERPAQIAAAVAERFARRPSFREWIAAEEEERERQAAAQARARAEAAEAEAVRLAVEQEKAAAENFDADAARRRMEKSHRVVLHAPIPSPLPHQARSHAARERDRAGEIAALQAEAEEILRSLTVEPAVALPAKLIEFPRELVAPRKARPRMVEGPLLPTEGHAEADGGTQLRIFEVASEAIARQPMPTAVAMEDAPVWADIRLDDVRRAPWEREREPVAQIAVPLQPATLGKRAAAAAVDAACVLAAFGGFVAVFFFSTTHPPLTRMGAEFGAAVFALLLLVYQAIFFTYAESTPGMRLARIALCTFDDANPSRRALRLRLGAALLAACPLGLGYLWAIVDEDGLGWHDRMMRMYQRSY